MFYNRRLTRSGQAMLLGRSSAPWQKRSDALFIDRDRRSLGCSADPLLLFYPFSSRSFTRSQEAFSQRAASLSFFFNLRGNQATQISLINVHLLHHNRKIFYFSYLFSLGIVVEPRSAVPLLLQSMARIPSEFESNDQIIARKGEEGSGKGSAHACSEMHVRACVSRFLRSSAELIPYLRVRPY